jgi:hypothetical protein
MDMLIAVGTIVAATTARPAAAQASNKLSNEITAREFAALPPYCLARMKGSAEERRMWEQNMGREIFLHLHHFCDGTNSLNRADSELDKRTRKSLLQRAIKNFDYVLKNWPEGAPLKIQAQSQKRRAELMLEMR